MHNPANKNHEQPKKIKSQIKIIYQTREKTITTKASKQKTTCP
jgi:hypothetical protein